MGVIRTDLGLSDSAMGLIVGAWPLVYISFAMPCGVFLDRAAQGAAPSVEFSRPWQTARPTRHGGLDQVIAVAVATKREHEAPAANIKR